VTRRPHLSTAADVHFGVMAFVWHVHLLSMLCCVALIQTDGKRTPRGIWIYGAAVPLLLIAWWPDGAAEVLENTSGLLHGVEPDRVWIRSLAGGAAAAIVWLAFEAVLFRVRRGDSTDRTNVPGKQLAVTAVAGLYLGPTRAIAATILAWILWRFWARRIAWCWFLAAVVWLEFML
jgi:hypothetical protein